MRLGRAPVVGVPDGSYGPLYPMLKYYGAELMEIKTSPAKAYLLASGVIFRTCLLSLMCSG